MVTRKEYREKNVDPKVYAGRRTQNCVRNNKVVMAYVLPRSVSRRVR